jgi:hypothetical protein
MVHQTRLFSVPKIAKGITHKIHLILIVGKERVQNKPEHQICNNHSTCICLERNTE